MGFVYLMKPVEHNVYKIGETIDIENRIIKYQRKFDFKLEYVDYFEVDDDIRWTVEHDLHRRFDRYHLGGEWFALPERIVSRFTLIGEEIKKIIIEREELLKEKFRTGELIKPKGFREG